MAKLAHFSVDPRVATILGENYSFSERALREQNQQNNLKAVFDSANGVTSGDPMGGMRVEHFRETRGFQPD